MNMSIDPTDGIPPEHRAHDLAAWSYEEAFVRNLGLISPQEQQRLRNSRVAIVGMGGVGGIHLVTLARLGVGRFTIADPDTFETANFNRQYGATLRGLGRPKTEVMAEEARVINPELDLRVFSEAITADNVVDFLADVDVFLDGVDFFGTAWLLFGPDGMSFDRYFDLHVGMDNLDQLVAFAVGLTPRATHLRYLDLSKVDLGTGAAPSVGLACQLASGVAAAEVAKILLGRGPLRPVPHYVQFDAYRCLLRRGYVRWGNRHPLQQLKRYILRRRMLTMG